MFYLTICHFRVWNRTMANNVRRSDITIIGRTRNLSFGINATSRSTQSPSSNHVDPFVMYLCVALLILATIVIIWFVKKKENLSAPPGESE